MKISIVAYPETLRSVAYGSITNSYAALGSVLSAPARMFRIINATNGDMLISLDGTNNHFFLTAGSFVLYDLCANRVQQGTSFELVKGTQFYIKYSSAPSSGSVNIEVIYGRGE